MKYIYAFFMSLGMFTAIPCPYRPWDEKARRLMLVFLPLVGLLIGLIWYGLWLLVRKGGFPLPLQAAILMLYPYLITGFIHLDGFMDTSDALLSRRPLEDKLRILKDPHTGAFAVISVAGLFIICYAAMSATVEQIHLKNALGIVESDIMLALIFVPVITRCCSSIAVLAGKPLAHSQYNEAKKSPISLKHADVRMRYKGEEGAKKPVAEVIAISLIGLAAIFAPLAMVTGAPVLETASLDKPTSYSMALVLACTLIAYNAVIFGAVRQFRGVSGDLAGYALTISEAVAVVVLALLA